MFHAWSDFTPSAISMVTNYCNLMSLQIEALNRASHELCLDATRFVRDFEADLSKATSLEGS